MGMYYSQLREIYEADHSLSTLDGEFFLIILQ